MHTPGDLQNGIYNSHVTIDDRMISLFRGENQS